MLIYAPVSASAEHYLLFTSALIVVVQQVRLSKIPSTSGNGSVSHWEDSCLACLVHEGQAISSISVLSSSTGCNFAGGSIELVVRVGVVFPDWG